MDPMAGEAFFDGMTHLKREKSRNNTTDAILNALDKKKYDGHDYRRFKAVVERLEEVGFYNIERDIKLENLEEIDEETWIPLRTLQSERILTEFFPGTPDNMKIALLMRTVNTDKYRGILDSMKIPGMVIPTYLELKRDQNHYATDRAEHEQKMKGGKRKARRRKIAHQSRRSRLMPLWQLCRRRGTSGDERRIETLMGNFEANPSRRNHRAAIRSKDYERESTSVITCTTISRNLLLARRLAATTRDRSRSLPQLRKITSLVDSTSTTVAPPLDFDMTIDTTFHQSLAYAIHALEGLRTIANSFQRNENQG
ncbi:hypothetical protein RI054_24g102880 [Pseudoscourfieldia marina]